MPSRSNAPRAVRHRTPTAEVERALLDAATDLIANEGPEALSVRRICSAAGVAPMGLYSRFGSKQGVVEALFIEGFQELREQFTTIDAADPRRALREACLRYRSHALANRTRYSIMFDRPIPDFVPSEGARRSAAESFDCLAALVATAMKAKAIRRGDPHEIAQRLWATCHGAVSLELRGLGFVDDRNVHFAALLDTMLRGLAP